MQLKGTYIYQMHGMDQHIHAPQGRTGEITWTITWIAEKSAHMDDHLDSREERTHGRSTR
jgi:hypothetical protein